MAQNKEVIAFRSQGARIQGLFFSRISENDLDEWIGSRALNSTNALCLFGDAQMLTKLNPYPEIRAFIKGADLLIARGKTLNLQINLKSRSRSLSFDHEPLYDRIVASLHGQNRPITVVTQNALDGYRIARLMTQRYPGLSVRFVTLGAQNELLSIAELEKLKQGGAQAVLLALPSPVQERCAEQLSKHLKRTLIFGLGEPLKLAFQSIIYGANQSVMDRIRRAKFSLLLNPISGSRYLLQLTHLKLNPERRFDPDKFNYALTSSQSAIRLIRARIRLHALLWQVSCNLQRISKRCVDLAGSGLGLLMLSPLLIFVAAAIKLNSPGPIFYSQIRVGYQGNRFRMWKFRSMYTDADARKAKLEAQNEMHGGVLFKMKNDPRITPVGRIIRRLSIDELPQLFNVITGEMSLVGPRPALESEVAQYPVEARARLEVLPGLTGLWQISGRSDLAFEQQVSLDTTYVHTQSTRNDIKLIARTVPAVLSGKGAY